MYFSGGGITFRGGHDSAGVTAPSKHWFFAEGATGTFFDMFLLLENPDPALTAHVTLTYLLTDGTRVPVSHDIEPNSRQTFNVQLEDPLTHDAALSTLVESDIAVVAERSMSLAQAVRRLDRSSQLSRRHRDGHEMGRRRRRGRRHLRRPDLRPHRQHFEFPRHRESDRAAQDRQSLGDDLALPANSRTNVPIGATPGFEAAINTHYGVIVESVATEGSQPAQIVIERSTYSNDAAGNIWAAGAVTLGTKLQ